MNIIKCTNCNNKFKWYQIICSIVFSRSHIIKCKKCNDSFKLTHNSYIIACLLILVIPLTITSSYVMFSNNLKPISFFIFILLQLIFSIIIPFVIKYEKLNK